MFKNIFLCIGYSLLMFSYGQNASAQNSSYRPDNFDYYAWNKKNCSLTDNTRIYTQLIEKVGNALGTPPSSVSLKHLAIDSEGCLATFQSPRRTLQCYAFFSAKDKVIWRIDCMMTSADHRMFCLNNDCPVFGK